MLAIINATLVMHDHLIPNAAVLTENGIIRDFGPMRSMSIPEGCEILDARGSFVGPGLVDIHTHCGGDVNFTADPAFAAQAHLRGGTTSVLPALYFSADQATYVAHLQKIRKAMQTPECANIAGVYMEGPYMNAKFGSNRLNNPWRGPIRREDYMPVVEAARDLARVWVLAPERENILDFMLDVKESDPAAVFSVGHSEASPQEIEALMPYGLKIGTHHTNATGDRIFYPEVRGVCVDETVNYNREIYAEMICDSCGIHVDPYMQRLIRRIKGEDRLILISDASATDGPVPPGYDGVTDISFDKTGEISGFCGTLNMACRNMMVHTGASIVDVFRYASTNPAKAVGFHDRGRIARGLRADLIVTDHWMNIQTVILKGERVI